MLVPALAGVDGDAHVIAPIVEPTQTGTDEPIRDAVEQRDTMGSIRPVAAAELVGLVTGALAEQRGEVAVVDRGEVHCERRRALGDSVGVIGPGDPHRPPSWMDAALRLKADEAAGPFTVRNGG